MAESKCVYLNQSGMYNLLVGFGFSTTLINIATMISSDFLGGLYYKPSIVDQYPGKSS